MGFVERDLDEITVVLRNPGTQAAGTDRYASYLPFACFLKNLYAELGVHGQTLSQISDLNKDGTTIFGADAVKVTHAPATGAVAFTGSGLNDATSGGNYSGTVAATFTAIIDGAVTAVAAVVFTGAGLNDATSSGTYAGTVGALFEVEIDATGTPDTFKWRKNGGSYTTGVAITGSAQLLSNGVSITFAATTGHTLANKWSITQPDTFKWKKDSGSFTTGVAITGSAQALSNSVTITFAAKTGHTLADQWTIAADPGLAATYGAISDANRKFPKGARFSLDVDSIHTTPGKGLVVHAVFSKRDPGTVTHVAPSALR